MADVRRVVAEAVAALGGLDVLVNNAGHMLGRIPLAEMDDAAIDGVFDLNARSVVAACRAALPALTASRGCIVNVTSISARSGGSAGSALYSARQGVRRRPSPARSRPSWRRRASASTRSRPARS